MKYYQGKFQPKNPEKYTGDAKNIIFRSSWELKCMKIFDERTDIIQWNSEELVIPYLSAVDNKIHRYFIDFVIKVKEKNGNIQLFAVEVKPYSQTIPPVKGKNITKRFITETIDYARNTSKWKYAEEYCSKNNMKFIILTEKDIFNNKL